MSRAHWKLALPAALLALGTIGGLLLPHPSRVPPSGPMAAPAPSRMPEASKLPTIHSAEPISTAAQKPVARPPKEFTPPKGALPNEMLLRFANAAAMQAFLAEAVRAGGHVLGTIPQFNAARIRFDNPAQGARIQALLPDGTPAGFNFVVAPPARPDPAQDPGGPYEGFGNHALDWLGVPQHNENWGAGVKVAVLDTDLTQVPGLATKSINQIDLVGQGNGSPDDPMHGTAMASIIASDSPEFRGIAPAAELTSIRVLDGDGIGNSFVVSQGVIDAVNGGARIISMSLGSPGDSAILADAVNYALEHNVAIVAAVGNEGLGSVSYPAKYPGVIGVTAVDANGQRAQFANYGPEVAIAAPGIDIPTQWSADKVLVMSGTSPAVPFVAGALAALVSQNPGMSVQQAANLMYQYADDAGAPGPDPMFGAGKLDLNRIINRNQPGINDIAVADFYYGSISASVGPQFMVTVQNLGTTSLANVKLDVTVDGQPKTYFINSIGAGAISTQILPLSSDQLENPDGISATSKVSLSGMQDAKPANDSKSILIKVK